MNGSECRNGDIVLRLGDSMDVLNDIGRADMVLTSPPYNIGNRGEVKRRDRKKGLCDIVNFSGPTYADSMDERTYQAEQQAVLRMWASRLAADGLIVYNHKNRYRQRKFISPLAWLLPLAAEGTLDICFEGVWDRGSTHNHCTARPWCQTERIYVLCRHGAKPYFQNEGWGDVWRIIPERGSFHSAPFPLELARRCIRLWCRPGGLVVDPYAGSATTAVACLLEGRRFAGAELEEGCYLKAVRRIQACVAGKGEKAAAAS